jgi:DNA-binding NtrC family response regulator
VITAANGQQCLDKVDKDAPELVLLDIEMPVKNGLEVLKELRRGGRDTTAIMITAYGTIERAVQSMKEGAFDFITKPFDLDHIALVVEKALERERLKRGLERFAEETGQRYRLIGGESPKMKLAMETARKAAASKSTVLLLGESGTGKEVFARAIHNWSERHRPSSPSPGLKDLRASCSAMKRSFEGISSRARWARHGGRFSRRVGISRRTANQAIDFFGTR